MTTGSVTCICPKCGSGLPDVASYPQHLSFCPAWASPTVAELVRVSMLSESNLASTYLQLLVLWERGGRIGHDIGH